MMAQGEDALRNIIASHERQIVGLKTDIRATLRAGAKWELDGEFCWCELKREPAWRRGTKIHSGFCERAGRLYCAAVTP